MNNPKKLIRIYGKSPACRETYALFSDAITNASTKRKSPPVLLEMNRKLFELDGNHEEPVIVVDGVITSEGQIPSRDAVLQLIGQVTALAA